MKYNTYTVMWGFMDKNGEPYTGTSIVHAETPEQAKEIVKKHHPKVTFFERVRNGRLMWEAEDLYPFTPVDTEDSCKVKDVKLYMDLNDFEPWNNAVGTWDKIIDANKLEAFDQMLVELFPDGLDQIELNDFLTSDDEYILQYLNISDDINDSAEPENIMWVKRKEDGLWRIWGSTVLEEKDLNKFLKDINKNEEKFSGKKDFYIDAKISENGKYPDGAKESEIYPKHLMKKED